MSGPLLPSLQAADLRRALTDFLSTTFALTDDDVRAALTDFLTDPDGGIFRGPFARLRLPFRQADGTWSVPLEWWPEHFTPYRHQAQAFERLSSRYGPPKPTIVTTGTGSGKTEAFLVPLIDHAVRMRRQGRQGMKALILYPMNALANDQAGRLAQMLTGDPRLGGITAGLYTGDLQSERTRVSAHGLITSREVMRSDPPDILLTNYKMLDQLLLRSVDKDLWAGAAESLTYVCLDEFHTYDGAQGTDVAMLLRRLGSALGIARPGAPLGDVVPVATSATLGAGTDTSLEAMRHFAGTVFGRPFDADAVIGEDRLSPSEWVAEQARPVPGVVVRRVPGAALLAGTVREARDRGPDAVADALLGALVARDEEGADLSAADIRRVRGRGHLPAVLAAHPLTGRLLDTALHPRTIRDLAAAVLPDDASPDNADGVAVIEAYLGLLSQARAHADGQAGRRLLGVDTQMWVREVSRIDRRVSTSPAFRWGDDGLAATTDLYLPSLYCRHCGRAGWGAMRSVTGNAIDMSDRGIRRASVARNQRFRVLLHAPGEATAAITDDERVEGLLWLDTASLELAAEPAADGEPDESPYVPVLTAWDDDTASRDQTCPACRQPDGIRFLGSSISTLTSVSLSALFGSGHLDAAEKKTLLFTDSVQDAAYTAGFVQARSHALSLRAALFDTVRQRGPMTLDDIPRAAMDLAGDDPVRRYRLVPPAVADWSVFQRYWQPSGSTQERNAARRVVETRLAFDAALELGLNARTGRTLELTGSLVTEVDTGSPEVMLRVASKAVNRAREQHSLSPGAEAALGAALDDARLAAWVRGILERIRTQGGIHHRWLNTYIDNDGNRWFLSGGRGPARDAGLPAFPPGRPTPAFPTTGRAETLDGMAGPTSWYSRWAQRQLRLTARDAHLVTRALLDEAAGAGWLATRRTDTNATVFTLEPARIVVAVAVADAAGLADGSLAVRCDVCQTLTPGTRRTTGDLAGACCLRGGCPGTLHHAVRGDDYYRHLYRSTDMRRVVAHEHTSLLPAKIRLAVEAAFRDGTGPSVPNVLAATPTLELGIDIGDLSTVMLGSLPRTVASYVQRVGRAGRLTGNALILAYVGGRGRNVQRLAAPLDLIDGEVRPPATYLDALEILQRQYVAWLVDRHARTGGHDERTAAELFSTAGWEPGTWMGDLLADAALHAAEYTDAYLALFGDAVRPDTAEHLRTWAGVGTDGPSGLAHLLQRAAIGYRQEADELGFRHTAVQDQIPDLLAAAARPTATDDDKISARMAQAELRFIKKRRADMGSQFWVAALEERGVLPNYTLLDDTVTLDVALRWTDQDTGEYQEEPRTYQRGSAMALTEWAPGATFYAQSTAVRIDAVDIGTDLEGLLETWRICSACGWSRVHRRSAGPEPQAPQVCPRCGDTGVADTGQSLAVLPLERVTAQVSRDAAAISDARDERARLPFTVVPIADVDPDQIATGWKLRGYPFGAEYVRQVEIRWVNVGKSVEQGSQRTLAGWQVSAPLFVVCPGCGVVPAAQPGVRDLAGAHHRGWCPLRTRMDIDWAELALGRTLRTQGVRILVPPQFTLDQFAGPSFRAALLLGMRELLGGDPDHLDILDVHMPVDGQDRTALLLHDRVPGGTGYLADLARPGRVHDLLTAALAVVRDCPCQADELLACPRCLLPFTPPAMVDRTSRVRAEQMLTDVLAADWEPEQVRSIVDIPLPSLESELEKRFRGTFADALRARGASVQEIPELAGTELRLAVPGATHRRWTLRPQVFVAGCRPDFELLCADPAVPRVYIFTDGRRWHATPDHNRIADDATKRQAVRDAGHVVWAVTDDDITTFEALTRGEHATAAGAAWYTGDVPRRLVTARGQSIPAGSISDATATADAVTQLIDWVTNPRPGAWRDLADGLPFALASVPPRPVASRLELPDIARAVLTDDPIGASDGAGSGGSGGLRAWYWRAGPLVVASAARVRSPFDIGAAVVVDDRPASLETDAGVMAWRGWLALSNILGHATRREPPCGLSQTGGPSVQPVVPSAVPVSLPAAEDVLPAPWAALVAAAADDTERALLRGLAAAGTMLPEQGYETDEGYPLDLAWPGPRIGVLVEPDDATITALAKDGWRIVGPDLDSVLELLTAAEGTS